MADLHQSYIDIRVGAQWDPKWPTDSAAMKALQSIVNLSRNSVRLIEEKAQELRKDSNLSELGRARKLKALVDAELKMLGEGAAAKNSQRAFKEHYAELEKIITAEARTPDTPHDIALAGEIRRHIASLKNVGERLSFLNEYAGNPAVVAAALSGPAFLSGMTDEQQERFKIQSREKLHPAEFAELRTMEEAYKVASQAFDGAKRMMVERAGLKLTPDGSVEIPGDQEKPTTAPMPVGAA